MRGRHILAAMELVDAFTAVLDPRLAGVAEGGELAATLASLVASARAAWPQLAISDTEFARHLAACLDPEAPVALDALRAADLYLALACARGDATAIALFEATLFGEIDRAGAAARASADLTAETRAHLREVLFVGTSERPPATLAYGGRGDLRGWVRVSALRHMVRIQARARREVVLVDDGLLEALSPAEDPELGYIRDLYRDAFGDAFRTAIAGLDRRQKSLLRYQLVEGLSIDEIGALHGVHRATAARWLSAAREALAEATRGLLAARLGIASQDIDSIIQLVRSRLDVSLERLIRDGDEPTR